MYQNLPIHWNTNLRLLQTLVCFLTKHPKTFVFVLFIKKKIKHSFPCSIKLGMAYRRLSKSVSAAIKVHNALSRPSLLLRSRALSASAHIISSTSFLRQPSSFIGAPRNGITSATQEAPRGQLLPLSLQLPFLRRFMSTVRGLGHK